MTEPYRIRSPETWAAAQADYLSGMDAEAVCSRHDLGLSALRRRARLHGWRRADQADPVPRDIDLAIYEDVELEDQVAMARLRFIQALDRGRSAEAMRWRRLHHELSRELRDVDAAFFAGESPEDRADFLDAMARERAALDGVPYEEDDEGPGWPSWDGGGRGEAGLDDQPRHALSADGFEDEEGGWDGSETEHARSAGAPPADPPPHSENVHDVHSDFSSAHSAPPNRAERRRRARADRRRSDDPIGARSRP